MDKVCLPITERDRQVVSADGRPGLVGQLGRLLLERIPEFVDFVDAQVERRVGVGAAVDVGDGIDVVVVAAVEFHVLVREFVLQCLLRFSVFC